MKAKRPKPKPRVEEPPEAPEAPEEAQDASLPRGRVLERPDGFYWESEGELIGPFVTRAEAEADALSGGASGDPSDPDALQETESELGINEWIDPDTGGPAEDSVPRLEDH